MKKRSLSYTVWAKSFAPRAKLKKVYIADSYTDALRFLEKKRSLYHMVSIQTPAKTRSRKGSVYPK